MFSANSLVCSAWREAFSFVSGLAAAFERFLALLTVQSAAEACDRFARDFQAAVAVFEFGELAGLLFFYALGERKRVHDDCFAADGTEGGAAFASGS